MTLLGAVNYKLFKTWTLQELLGRNFGNYIAQIFFFSRKNLHQVNNKRCLTEIKCSRLNFIEHTLKNHNEIIERTRIEIPKKAVVREVQKIHEGGMLLSKLKRREFIREF